jgi:hypothetical protein
VNAWGWTQVTSGIVLTISGWALLSGETWARVVGIVLAALSAITSLAFVRLDPATSLLAVALDGFVIWALAARGLAAKTAEGTEGP